MTVRKCGEPELTLWPYSKTRDYGHFEVQLRDFNKYRRGRTLAQFCRDEGIDYDWMLKVKRKYSGRARQIQSEESTDETDSLPSLIELHYEDDSGFQPDDERKSTDRG